jgi:hypothetical protein
MTVAPPLLLDCRRLLFDCQRSLSSGGRFSHCEPPSEPACSANSFSSHSYEVLARKPFRINSGLRCELRVRNKGLKTIQNHTLARRSRISLLFTHSYEKGGRGSREGAIHRLREAPEGQRLGFLRSTPIGVARGGLAR